MNITASCPDIRDTIARIVLDTMASRADSETYGDSYAKVFNERRAERAADAILGLLQPSPSSERCPTCIADKIISEIEKRFPGWEGYRDLIDCIDCTLHALRSSSMPVGWGGHLPGDIEP